MKQLIIFAMAAMFGLASFAGNTGDVTGGDTPKVGDQVELIFYGTKFFPDRYPPCGGRTTKIGVIDKFTVVSAVENEASTSVVCKFLRFLAKDGTTQSDDIEFVVPHGVGLKEAIIDAMRVYAATHADSGIWIDYEKCNKHRAVVAIGIAVAPGRHVCTDREIF